MAESEFDNPKPVSLHSMVIGSVDTLRGTDLLQRIPPTWHDQPPLIRGRKNTPETPVLLKGVSEERYICMFRSEVTDRSRFSDFYFTSF